MKRTIVALMTAIAITSPVYAEAPTYINTVTGLTIPVYPDWKQETLAGGITQCTPAFGGGFFQIMDTQPSEPIAEDRVDYTYYLLEKQEDEDTAYNLLNIDNDELLGKDVAYTKMMVASDNGLFYSEKLHFINNGNITIVTMICNVANTEQFTNEFDNWVDTFTLSE